MDRSPGRDLIVGLFVLAGLTALGWLSFSVGGFTFHGRGGLQLFADFGETGDLKVHAPVVIAGIRVGEVSSLSLEKSFRARVEMDLDPNLQLPTDTSASIVTAGVLGDRYIALQPGGDDRLLRSGDRISFTESAVILERLIGQLVYGNYPGRAEGCPRIRSLTPCDRAIGLELASHEKSPIRVGLDRSGISSPGDMLSRPNSPGDSAGVRPLSPRGRRRRHARDVLKILRDPSLQKADKLTQIRQIADQHIDFEALARLSLGQYWRDLSDSQKAEFVKEFENHVSTVHGKVFDEYVDEDVTIIGDRQEQRGDYTVQTRIVANRIEAGRRKDVADVDYRLRQKDNRWQVIDITIDGVSMAMNFRAQFQEIMANGGYDRLIKLLREKQVTPEK